MRGGYSSSSREWVAVSGNDYEVKSTLKANVTDFVSGMGKAGGAAKRMGRDVASTKGDMDKANKAGKDVTKTIEKMPQAKARMDNRGFLRGAQQVGKAHQKMSDDAKNSPEFKPKADVKGFIRDANEAAEAAKRVGSAMQSIYDKSQEIDQKLMTTGKVAAGAGATIEGVMIANTKTAADFEEQLNNVYTIVDRGAPGAGKFSKQLQDMSTKYPIAAKDLAAGLYDITSSGIKSSQAIDVLDISSKAASAGMTEASTSSRALTAALNAYGKDAGQAAYMSDIMFQTVNMGVLTFDELAQNMGQWVGMAAAAGVGFDDASAALAGMTLAGIPAAEASTALARTMQAFVKPSETMTSLVRRLGFETPLTMVKTLGLKGSIDKLNEVTGGSPDLLADVFQEVTALNGVMALGTAGGKNYARVYDTITDSTKTNGATSRAYQEQQKSLNMQLEKLKNTFTKLRIEMGERLIPIFKFFAGVLDTAMRMLDAIPGPIKTLMTYAMALGGILMILGGYFIATKIRAAIFNAGIKQLNKGLNNHAIRQKAAANGGVRLTGSLKKTATAYGHNIPIIGRHIAATNRSIKAQQKLSRENAKLVHVTKQYIPQGGSFTRTLFLMATAHGHNIPVLGKHIRKLNEMKLTTGRMAMAAGIATAGIMMMTTNFFALVDGMKAAKKEGKDAAEGFFTGMTGKNDLEAMRSGLHDVTKEYQQLHGEAFNNGIYDQFSDAMGAITGSGSKINEARNKANAMWDVIEGKQVDFRNLNQNVSELGRAYGMSSDQVIALADAAGIDLTGALLSSGRVASKTGQKIASDFEEAKNQASRGAAASKQLTENLKAADDAAAGLGDTLELTDVAKNLQTSLQSIGSGTTSMADSLQKKQETVRSWGQAAVDAGNMSEEAFTKASANVKLTLAESTNALKQANTDMLNWRKDLVIVAERAGSDVAQYFANMGSDGVDLVHQMATGTDKETKEMADQVKLNSKLTGDNAASELEAGLLIAQQKGADGAKATRQAISNELGLLVPDVARISKQYGIELIGGINPVLQAMGRNPIDIGSADDYRARGYNSNYTSVGGKDYSVEKNAYGSTPSERLPGRATFHRGRTLVQWAEPETQGEWFIPAAKSKRGRSERILADAAASFGYQLTQMADGGFMTSADVPKPPRGPGGGVFRSGAESGFRGAYEKVKTFLDGFSTFLTTPGGSGASGINPKLMMQYNMYNRALGNILTITSGWRSRAQQAALFREKGGYSSSHAGAARPGTSMHEKGLAIDHSPHSTSSMRSLASRFGLRYPMGNEPWHVQPVWAANGGFMKNAMMNVFDSGGVLSPGRNMVYNATGSPEKLVRADGVGASHSISVDIDLRGASITGVDELESRLEDAGTKMVRQLTSSLRKV